MILTLTGVDAQGNPLPSQTIVSGSDGSYLFSNLAAGTYTITQAQPAGLMDGTVAVGSLGGSAGVNSISGIAVDGSSSGTAYNFAELGVASSMISMRLFLASSPSPEQTLKTYATQYGTAEPLVMSIVKADADPSDADTVSYTVTFNESVTGVDTSDFAASGIDGASIASVTGSGTTYTVVVSTGGGSGSLTLTLVDDDSIIRDASTPLGGTGTGNGDFVGPAYTITSTAPAVAVSAVTDPINAANQGSVTASGTGEVGATITLTATDGTNTTTEYTTTVGDSGTWSISGIDTSGLADGTITFNVAATNTGGNSANATITATKDTVAPGVTLGEVTDPINSDNENDVTASGTGEVGATIKLIGSDGTNSTSNYTVTVGSDGTWTISGIDVSGLADGTITFTATATDAAGNSAESTLTATKDTVAPAVTLAEVTDPITIANHTETQANGTGEVGATVKVVASDGTNSTTEYTTTIGEDGTWSITGIDTNGLADGTITFTATASDAAGNTSQSTLTAEKITVAVVSVTDPINAENAASVTVSGTGEAGATITLTATDGTHTTIEYTTVIGENGTWTIEGIDVSELADGTITFTATATDSEENMAETSKSATKDTVAPEVAIDGPIEPINLANATSVTVTGTGEAGATITLTATDGTHASTEYTTTVGENGAWTIEGVDVSELADGTLTFTATATDAAGNSAETTATANKDTTVPAVTLDAIAAPLTIATYRDLQVSGMGEVGATISVVVGDGTHSTSEYTTTVGEDGTWSISGIDTSGLADGTLTITVTATDGVGNSAEASTTVTKTTVAIDALANPINEAGSRERHRQWHGRNWGHHHANGHRRHPHHDRIHDRDR